jgi:hypothetical protein
MEHAVHAPHVPHVPQQVIVPVIAFLIGGGATVGIVALSGGLKSSHTSAPPTVILSSPSSHNSPSAQTSGARP